MNSHSFVAARLLPRLPKSAEYGAKYGQSVLTSFPAKSFLALHIQRPISRSHAANLFVVSTQQPTSPGSEYFVLNSTQTELESNARTLTVLPPLPFKEPLYLLVTPRISALFFDDEAYQGLVNAENYQLDTASFERFLKTLKGAGPSILAPAATVREKGGNGEPSPIWDTWSEYSSRQGEGYGIPGWHRKVRFRFHFDLIPFNSLPTDLGLHVFDELPLVRQVYIDYTWKGCGPVFRYFESMRREIPFALGASERIIRLPDLPSRQPDPSVDALLPSTPHLQSLPVIHDGDPRVESEDSDDIADDWKNEPVDTSRGNPEANPWAVPMPVVRANSKDVKVIVLDSNVLIDRDGPLQDALAHIFPPSQHNFAPKELLDLYIEYETLRAADGQPDSPTATRTVQDVARYLSISANESAIHTALEDYAKPRLYPETSNIIASLIEHGYSLLVLPSLVSSFGDSALALLPQLPGLSVFKSSPVASDPPGSGTWESLMQSYPTLQRNQILVVTNDICRTLEPATLAGFPTAFIKSAGNRSAALLSLPPTPPTFTFTTLAELVHSLKDGIASAPESEDPQDVTIVKLLDNLRDAGRTGPKSSAQYDLNELLNSLRVAGRTSVKASQAFDHFVDHLTNPPMRIHDCYQMQTMAEFSLGSGSFADVYNGTQLDTGAQVAVKFESKSTILPYEAAVYAQLKGVPGVPRIHWSGADGNAYMIVMDKLGPNLDQLRRICRGRFGLKTVLMLGEQMLSIIEEVHARGIIVRDINPQNFAMGFMEDFKRLHLLDFGLSKLWLDPTTGKHIPFREGRHGIGTARYASCNYHLGLEQSRRDDLEAIGYVLLYLLHGRVPWQGLGNVSEKRRLMGEIKLQLKNPDGKMVADLLAHEPETPEFLIELFKHCRNLAFEDKPDYRMLRRLIRTEFERRGWGGEYDWEYDWWTGNGGRGTLLTGEYKLDPRLVEPAREQQRAW